MLVPLTQGSGLGTSRGRRDSYPCVVADWGRCKLEGREGVFSAWWKRLRHDFRGVGLTVRTHLIPGPVLPLDGRGEVFSSITFLHTLASMISLGMRDCSLVTPLLAFLQKAGSAFSVIM